MPNNYPEKKGWKVPKQKFKVTNWLEYSKSLRRRGNITVWLSDDAISQWYDQHRSELVIKMRRNMQLCAARRKAPYPELI